MKNIIAFLVAAVGVIAGLYVGVWLLFIQPIIQACAAFDAGTLTGMIVGMTVLKCIFASFVAGIIIVISFWIAGVIQMCGRKKKY